MLGSEVVARIEPRTPAAATPRRAGKRLIAIALIAAAALIASFLLSQAGSFLIVHAPEPSDVIVVLDGEWPQAVKLQKEGYAPRILLDAGRFQVYGRSEFDLATEFLQKEKHPGMELCPTTGDSTYDEAADVERCLAPLHVHSVLLVATNFDTRRALELFRKRLPQYRWSMAASSAPFHDADQYWKHRAWAKTVLNAWEQYLWWKLVDQWRSDMVLR
ncbi:MAG TPA: ElyC/SanA/YdcF family protein [Terriglobales bacterium]|nr:ElyC/SanA/YdcF family protein [Terriglobales bacterium]